MAALGGSRHALINLSTQIDIPPIIKKSLSPATGYFGHKDEQSHHLNTFYVSFASVCALQMGAFCILQNFFQRNFCFRPAFEKVVCIITRKGEVLPPFDRKEVRTWNLIAENFKSNVPFKVSVNGCCTTKRATPTTKSGDAPKRSPSAKSTERQLPLSCKCYYENIINFSRSHLLWRLLSPGLRSTNIWKISLTRPLSPGGYLPSLYYLQE